MRTRAVVFDLDGTLIDSVADIRRALNLALEEAGLGAISTKQARGMIGSGARILLERALAVLGVSDEKVDIELLVDRFEAHYLTLGAGESVVFRGGRELLERLSREGLSLGICTNKPDEITQVVVRELGLAKYFGSVLGVRAGLDRKPAPDMLLAVCRDLGCAPAEALMIGDSAIDVEAARAAGVPVIVVSFGYTQVPAVALGADGVLDDLKDVWCHVVR